MNTSEWPDVLDDPQQIISLFDQPPLLSACGIFYFHLDERGDSITLGFDTRQIPDRPLPEWAGSTYNAYEFFLTFWKVSELRIRGLGSPGNVDVQLSKMRPGVIEVVLSGEDEHIHFRSESSTLTRSHVYLASSVE